MWNKIFFLIGTWNWFKQICQKWILFQIKNYFYIIIVGVVSVLSFQLFTLSALFLFSRKEAQLDEEGQFLVRIIYDDSKTYDLVAAASKVLSKLNATFFLWLSCTSMSKGMHGPRSHCMVAQVVHCTTLMGGQSHIVLGSGYTKLCYSFYKLFRE